MIWNSRMLSSIWVVQQQWILFCRTWNYINNGYCHVTSEITSTMGIVISPQKLHEQLIVLSYLKSHQQLILLCHIWNSINIHFVILVTHQSSTMTMNIVMLLSVHSMSFLLAVFFLYQSNKSLTPEVFHSKLQTLLCHKSYSDPFGPCKPWDRFPSAPLPIFYVRLSTC